MGSKNTNKKLLFAGFGIVTSMALVMLAALAVASKDTTARPTKLGDVPGFRVDAQGIVDDDTILLWEAFQREKHVQQCMVEDGYDYTLDAAFPAGSLRAVADAIGAVGNTSDHSGDDNAVASGSMRTNSDIDSLSPQQLNGYYLTLYGETADDVAYVDSTGFLPTGRNDFAQGGCFGAAAALPHLGTTMSIISNDVQSEKAIEMASAAPCVTPNGVKLAGLAELELAFIDVYDDPSISDQFKKAFESDVFACWDDLERENAAASARAKVTVFNRHKKLLENHAERYGLIESKISEDDEFKEYLRNTVTELDQSWNDIDTNPANSG